MHSRKAKRKNVNDFFIYGINEPRRTDYALLWPPEKSKIKRNAYISRE